MYATRNAYKRFEMKSRVKRAERNCKIYRLVLLAYTFEVLRVGETFHEVNPDNTTNSVTTSQKKHCLSAARMNSFNTVLGKVVQLGTCTKLR
jgi:hypothetical protein